MATRRPKVPTAIRRSLRKNLCLAAKVHVADISNLDGVPDTRVIRMSESLRWLKK
jgi:hypothetical protein